MCACLGSSLHQIYVETLFSMKENVKIKLLLNYNIVLNYKPIFVDF